MSGPKALKGDLVRPVQVENSMKDHDGVFRVFHTSIHCILPSALRGRRIIVLILQLTPKP
jgi:hypothetical protein